MPRTSLEIHFHRQDEASVLLGGDPAGDPREAELLLFSLYAARQALVLGASHGFGPALAALLLQVDEAPGPQLGDGALGARLVPHAGRRGPRRYRASLEYETPDDPAGIRFGLSAVGFGVLGRGAGYYAPASVLALLRHLLAARRDDGPYSAALAAAARHLGATLPYAEPSGQLALALSACAVARGELSRNDGADDVDDLAGPTGRFTALWHEASEPPANVGAALAIAARALLEPGQPEAAGDDPRFRVFLRTALGGYLWRLAEAGDASALDRALAKAALAAARPGADDDFNLFAAARRCVLDGIPLSQGSPGGSAVVLEAGYQRLLDGLLPAGERTLVDARLLRVAFRCGVAVRDLVDLFAREPELVEAQRTKPRHRSFRLTREPEAVTLAPPRGAPGHRSFRLSR